MKAAKKLMAFSLSVMICVSMAGLPAFAQTVSESTSNQTYSDSSSGGHAVYVSGKTVTLTNPTITKTGNSSSENADFYGTNAAVLAENKANLTIEGGSVTSNGSHANGIFSYGTAIVNVNKTKIETKGNNSGGLMTTGGGTMNASDLSVVTSGNSSAAIRSDRGGGDVNVSGGTYKTTGTGSPVIYSTADIDVENAALESSGSEAIVIEGGNSVELKNCTVTGNNTKLNGQAKNYDSIFIYQSMSGDASAGNSLFSSTGGTITSKNGDTFYITNTTTTINLTNTTIVNSASGNFLVAEAAAWGKSGSNGGKVTLNASKETINGNILTDSISSIALKLSDASTFKGAINPSGEKGTVSVTISSGSTWTLTADSYVKSLTCENNAINLNGHTLYVDGKAYTANGTSTKKANPLSIKAKTATIKYSKLKKKTQTLAVTKVIKFVKKGQGTMSYKLSSAKKNKKSFKKYFKVNTKTGKITIKKGLKKGTYKVKVKVKAAGNANYKASAEKTVTISIKVR